MTTTQRAAWAALAGGLVLATWVVLLSLPERVDPMSGLALVVGMMIPMAIIATVVAWRLVPHVAQDAHLQWSRILRGPIVVAAVVGVLWLLTWVLSSPRIVEGFAQGLLAFVATLTIFTVPLVLWTAVLRLVKR